MTEKHSTELDTIRPGAPGNEWHADTIGEHHCNGNTYQIDWPRAVDAENKRCPDLGAIYLSDTQVAEFGSQWGNPFTTEQQVIEAGIETIHNGATTDQIWKKLRPQSQGEG